jgi:hypothetical protein
VHPETNEIHYGFAPCGKAPDTITLEDGTVCKRNLGAEIVGRGRRSGATWPMESDALGVHPDQVAEARKESERLGVPTNFTSDGKAILESRAHRKAFAEALGFYDRNGGYGDPQRK